MLIFARHGNTFEDSETPRMVGAGEDLALTSKGRDQARDMGRALRAAGINLSSVHAGPLKRTTEFAQIVAELVGFAGVVTEDQRLRELDFGNWSGLSDSEIADRFGQSVLDDWRLEGRRPATGGWAPDEDVIRKDLSTLLAEVRDPCLCITSNGILRYLMEFDAAAFKSRGRNGGFRVKTGNLCLLERGSGGIRIRVWNQRADARVLAFAAFSCGDVTAATS